MILRKLLIAAAMAANTASADDLSGVASVIDGDTIEVHGQRIRLFGIDTPEKQQPCWDGGGQQYRCGQKAALVLSDYIGSSPVACQQQATDRYHRIVARCSVRGESVNAYMVRSGWAAAYRRYGTDYVAEEQEARNVKRGLWAGQFEMPWDWRKERREHSEPRGFFDGRE